MDEVKTSLEAQINILMKTITGDMKPIQNKQIFNSGAIWILGGIGIVLIPLLSAIIPILVHTK